MWRFENQTVRAWTDARLFLDGLPEPLLSQWHKQERALLSRVNIDDFDLLPSLLGLFPSLPLVWWTARAVDFHDDEVCHDLAVGAALEYLTLRFQDDVLDDHTSGEALLLGNVCREEFARLYHPHFPANHPFWGLWREWMTTFSATTLWEIVEHRQQRNPYTSTDLDRLGEKFIPAAAPPAAVAFLADRPDLIHHIKEFVLTLGSGLQLMNDHRGIAHDFATENYTALITDILLGVPKIRPFEKVAFPNRALTSDAMERNLLRATIYLDRSRHLAESSGLVAATGYIDEHRRFLAEERKRLEAMRQTATGMSKRDHAEQAEA
ncbi:MAG: hypothetical protein J7M25_17710 [Deltaproteobacteria bacterium]|nr:hypothetical protein [Deltaproteobacteria bacterium]